MFKIVMMEGTTAVERSARFYHELINDDTNVTEAIFNGGDSLLFSKIPEGGAVVAILSRGAGNILFQLDRNNVVTSTPLRSLSAFARGGVPDIYVFVLPSLIDIPEYGRTNFLKTEDDVRAMLEVETDTILDTNDMANFIKEIMAPRKEVAAIEVATDVSVPLRSNASKAEPVPAEELTIVKFLGEVVAPEKLAENVVNYMYTDGRFMIPREKVSAKLLVEVKEEKTTKNKPNPSDVVKKLAAKLSKNSSAPKKAVPTTPDDLHTLSAKLGRTCISDFSEDMIDELYKVNTSSYAERVKRLNSLAFESIYDACTSNKNLVVCRNNLAKAGKSLFNGNALIVEMNCSFSDRPSHFKSPGLRGIGRIKAYFGLEKKEGKLSITCANRPSDSREAWAVDTGIAIANKFLERTLTEESAFEDCLYIQTQRMFHLNTAGNKVYTASEWKSDTCPTHGMKYILAAAAAKMEAVSLEGIRVTANPSLGSVLEDAGLENTTDGKEAAIHAIGNWIHRAMELGYYSNDTSGCNLFTILPESSDSLKAIGLGSDVVSMGAKVRVDVSVYMSAITIADVLLSYLADIANTVCEMASPKVHAAYYVSTDTSTPIDVVYGLGNNTPHVVSKFVKYKRNMYLAVPLLPIIGDAHGKIYGYHNYDYTRTRMALATSIDSVLSTMKSNMSSVASMLRGTEGEYLQTALGITREKPLLMLHNGLQELIWSNATRHLTSDNRLKLESMFEAMLNSICDKMYVITDRRPLIAQELKYSNHEITVYKEKKVNAELCNNEYLNILELDKMGEEIPDEIKEYIQTFSRSVKAKRGRVGSKMDGARESRYPTSLFYSTRGIVDPDKCNEVLSKHRIIYAISAGHVSNYASTALGHMPECTFDTESMRESVNLNTVSESSEVYADLARNIRDVVAVRDSLTTKYPEYKIAARLPNERGYVSEACQIVSRGGIKTLVSNALEVDTLAQTEQSILWTDTERLKQTRSNRGNGGRTVRPLALTLESPNLKRIMYIRNGLLLKDKDLMKYRILTALASLIPLGEIAAPTNEEIEEMCSAVPDRYVQSEISSVLRVNKKRLIKEAMTAKAAKLRSLREQYAKEFRESVPILRSSSRELRELKTADAILTDEQKISRLIASGEILGARVCGSDISVLLPQANIWAYASVYNIGKVVLVLTGFGTSNAQAFFYCNNHLETRYPRDIAQRIGATEARTIDAPHVRNGVACYGNIAPALRDAMSKGDLTSTVLLCKSYVNSVNLNDGYGNNIYKWPSVPATLYNLIKFGVFHAGHPSQASRIVFTPDRYAAIETMTWDLYATAYETWRHKLDIPEYSHHKWTDSQWAKLADLNSVNDTVSAISYKYGESIVPEIPESVLRRSEELLFSILKDPKMINSNHSKKNHYDIWGGAELSALIPQQAFSESETERILESVRIVTEKRKEYYDGHAASQTSPTSSSNWSYFVNTTGWTSIYAHTFNGTTTTA